MIRLNPQRRVHIPNRLALVGALALAATWLVCYDDNAAGAEELPSGNAQTAAQQVPDSRQEPAARERRFTVSRLLFGHG